MKEDNNKAINSALRKANGLQSLAAKRAKYILVADGSIEQCIELVSVHFHDDYVEVILYEDSQKYPGKNHDVTVTDRQLAIPNNEWSSFIYGKSRLTEINTMMGEKEEEKDRIDDEIIKLEAEIKMLKERRDVLVTDKCSLVSKRNELLKDPILAKELKQS